MILCDYVARVRQFNRDTRIYLFVSTLVGFSILPGIPTVLTNLYLLRLGYGLGFIGLISGMASLGYSLSCLPAGAISRRWGVRRTMTLGLGLCTIAYALFTLGEALPSSLREGWLVGTRLLSSFGLALYFVNARPFLMAVTRVEERSHVFSVGAALRPLGGFLGNLVAGLLPGLFAQVFSLSLEHPLPYRYPLLLSSLLLIPAVLALRTASDIAPGHASCSQSTVGQASALPLATILSLSLVNFLRSAGWAAMRTFFNVYLDTVLHMPPSFIGSLGAAGQLLGMAAALTTPYWASRFGLVATYVLAALGMALHILLLALVPHWLVAAIASMSVNALSAITMPTMSIYQMESVAPDWRATTAGTISMSMGFARSAMGLVGSTFIAGIGYGGTFLTGAGLMTAGALYFWAFHKRRRKELAR